MTSNSMTISLPTMEHVEQFIDTIGRFPFEMSLSNGKYIVDARSIMGIFSLDLRQPLVLTVEADDPTSVFEALKMFRCRDEV